MSEADDPKRDEGAEGGEPTAPESPRADKSADKSAEPDDFPPEDEAMDGLDEVDLREMMRHALARPPQGGAPDLLKGVQKRIRTRSRGKFYNDGWSTARTPRSTYLITSLVMLILIGFVFLVLIPWSRSALPLP